MTTTRTTDTNPTDDVTAASAALRALAATDGGEVLAGQLSRLVAVIANEAVRTRSFRSDLVAALVPEPTITEDLAGPFSEGKLQRMTKAELQKLITAQGMDPDRTIKSRTTKGEMIALVLAFQESVQGLAGVGPDKGSEMSHSDTPVAATKSSVGVAPEAIAPEPATADTRDSETDAAGREVPESLPPSNPPKSRRRPSPLDPYAVVADDGVDGLRQRLQALDIEELKDIIAEYGMNHDGRAMSWKDHRRFVNRIIEKVDFGTTQGSAFRS